MSKATLTKRIEFCASHRYHNLKWDDETNKRMFGPCNNENSHGHNYLLEVTLRGEIDPVTGMIINLYDLKQILTEVLEEFDHKYLNLDTPYFTDRIPTTENLALTLWNTLEKHPQVPALDRIRLYEDHTLFAEVSSELLKASPEQPHASVSRRYYFSAAHSMASDQALGHNYTIEITINGPIDSETGQVINIQALDQLVQDRILQRFHGKNMSLDPAFLDNPVSEGCLARLLWDILEKSQISQGELALVTISEGQDTLATYRRG